jgi:hypothetical protein
MNQPSKEAIELVHRIREKMAVDEFIREQKLERTDLLSTSTQRI